MYINDKLFEKVEPAAMSILIYMVNKADENGIVTVGYRKIAEALNYDPNFVYRTIKYLEGLKAIVKHQVKQSVKHQVKHQVKQSGSLIKVSNIECYRLKRAPNEAVCEAVSEAPSEAVSEAVKKPTKPTLPMSERTEAFIKKANEYSEQYGNAMIVAFCQYWTEANENGAKMRFEKEKTFDIRRRLERWHRQDNEKKQKTTSSTAYSGLHQDGTILHNGQMDVTQGGW